MEAPNAISIEHYCRMLYANRKRLGRPGEWASDELNRVVMKNHPNPGEFFASDQYKRCLQIATNGKPDQ